MLIRGTITLCGISWVKELTLQCQKCKRQMLNSVAYEGAVRRHLVRGRSVLGHFGLTSGLKLSIVHNSFV